MGQPRPRHRSRRPLIIRRSDLQSRRQRLLYGSLTTLFWAGFTALWQPVFTLAAWAFGWQRVEHYLGGRANPGELFAMLKLEIAMIVVLVGALYGWAFYNLRRFHGVERRAEAPAVTLEQVARVHGVRERDLARWQRARVLTVHHRDDGRIRAVQLGAFPGASTGAVASGAAGGMTGVAPGTPSSRAPSREASAGVAT